MNRETKDSGINWIGEIPKNWDVKPIKRNYKIISGATPKSNNEENWGGDITWITPADFKASGKYIATGRKNITEKGYNSCSTTIVPTNSIIFSKRAPVGTVAINSNELCTNQGCLSCVPFKETNSSFGYYSMLAGKCIFEISAQGTTFMEISANDFANIKLPIAPLEEQEEIAKFLDVKCEAIDQAIQKQKDIVIKLKEYKQSTITQAVTKGLNPDVEMKDSGIPWIGEMPEKWGVMRLKDTSWLKGRIGWDGLKASEFIDEGPYLITGTDFCDGYINWDTCVHITKQRFEEDTLLHIRENDLLITKDGTVGKVAIAKDCPKETSLNSGVMIIRNKSRYIYNSKYMYYILLSDEFKHWFGYSQKPGSTIKHLYQHQFGEFKHTFPPLEEQQQIADFLDSKCSKINESIEQSNKVIQKLEEYKKSLIYNAVTGKIDCRNA